MNKFFLSEMKSLYLLVTWYATVVCTLIFALLFLVHLNFAQTFPNGLKPHYQSYKALPLATYTINQEVKISYSEATPEK